jgi:pyruvate,water dikinase
MNEIRLFEHIDPGDSESVGGKGLSLGQMTRAGLPVPPGFCITSAAHRRLRGRPPHTDDVLARAIVEAYQQLGGGAVAVRSSATAEDGVVNSFAGQQETILGVVGEKALLDAVARCWDSLESERARVYRRQRGGAVSDERGGAVSDRAPTAGNGLAMAVVVQRLVPADVAGVLFTRDPLDPEGRRMLVEASWGLGESVVSGQVMPDRFHLDRDTGAVCERHISTKTLRRTAAGPEPVPPPLQNQPCLDDAQLGQLAEVGRQVERFYSGPRDVEWALVDGRFWLLQARPITTADAAEREQVRREEIAALQALADPRGTVWSRFNLSESLPEPTPMTWAIVRRFMSGRGGFGLMYRDFGYRPHASLDESGAYDLICGRPYCNLSREPLFYPGLYPREHPVARLEEDPRRAFYPEPVSRPGRVGLLFWLTFPLRLPVAIWRGLRLGARLGSLAQNFAARFRKEVLPPYSAEVEREAREDHAGLTTPALLERLEFWVHRTLYDFARDSLKPTLLAHVARATLKHNLGRKLSPERTEAVLGELTMGVRADPDADFPAAIRDLEAGRLERDTFLHRFGHRGPQEMELAQPRWAEDHAALDRLVEQARGEATRTEPAEEERRAAWEQIVTEAKLSGLKRILLEPQVEALRTYTGLRETAKHHLMRGYALIRRFLLAMDQRFQLDGGIFFLTPDELPRLSAGEDLSEEIARRRRRRAASLSLEVPPVLFSTDLKAIGRPIVVEGAERLEGVPLSAGSAEAPALVLERPVAEDGLPADPYILVCPSTDPAWVPLFVRARGLVMETGGVLSHGAIVAREFGLPAVAGLPGVTKRLHTGQRLRVDGGNGCVTVLRLGG